MAVAGTVKTSTPLLPVGGRRYRNPILDADWPDLDVVRVDDLFVLVASSFSVAPGLPVLVSRDLVHWSFAGRALPHLPPAGRFVEPEHGRGVWAPAIRHHAGRYRVYWGDPDEGIWTISAERPEGPWSAPVLVLRGRGLIDPCPLFDDDGRVWLVHAWAQSRSGISNRLDIVELDSDGQRPISASSVLIDGDDIPGCTVLEGPKLYHARGHYWVFAPAGGVATGWQFAFRADRLDRPWEHRVVLSQGDTDVNGPHQGAWVDTPAGEDWFLHFQDRGWAGRVTHLQPMTWDDEGWPVVGDHGAPVAGWQAPAALPHETATPAVADDWRAGLGPQWAWQAQPPAGDAWASAAGGTLELTAVPPPALHPRRIAAMLSQPLPGSGISLSAEFEAAGSDMRGGCAVLGARSLTCELVGSEDGAELVVSTWTDDPAPIVLARAVAGTSRVRVRLDVDRDGRCRLTATEGSRTIAQVSDWQAHAGTWVGAQFGLYAAGVDGVLRVGPLSASPLSART
jgi:hypothetical protein